MFRRKRTRADPSLVDSLALSFGCSFVDSFIRSVSQYMIHVFIHSCCMHRRKRARARLFVRPVIHPFINSVSQSVRVYHSRISLFVCSFVHSSIHFFRQSVSLLRQNGRRVTKVYWPSLFSQDGCIFLGGWGWGRGGGKTVIVANMQLSWPHTWPLTHFSWPPAPKVQLCCSFTTSKILLTIT